MKEIDSRKNHFYLGLSLSVNAILPINSNELLMIFLNVNCPNLCKDKKSKNYLIKIVKENFNKIPITVSILESNKNFIEKSLMFRLRRHPYF